MTVKSFLGNIKHKCYQVISGKFFDQLQLRKEETRLANMPRFKETLTTLLGKTIKIPDTASYLFTKDEIFKKSIYKFKTTAIEPYILDCGANIGLSCIYLKGLYPNAKIIAFEPDKKIAAYFNYNISVFNLNNITLIEKACWTDDIVHSFYSEGADGGRFAIENDKNKDLINVETVRLRKYINCKVDFLKIDIEGAEYDVLKDISDLLYNVEHIFIEYHSFVGQAQYLPEIITILKTAGFRLHVSSPGVVSKNPFMKLEEWANMDNQLNIYGMR